MSNNSENSHELDGTKCYFWVSAILWELQMVAFDSLVRKQKPNIPK